MRVITIGGVTIDWSVTNQTGDYTAWIDAPFSQPAATTTVIDRPGSWPIGTSRRRAVFTLPPIYVAIMDTANETALRAQLLRALDTSQEFKALVLADDDGGNPRYWMCDFQTGEEYERQKGLGLVYVVTATVVGDVYRRAITPTVVSGEVDASGESMTVVNPGDMDAYPTIAVTATAAKATAVWTYPRTIAVRWRSPFGGEHPIDVTDGGLDTAALLTATKIANAANIGVYINGAYRPFFILAADAQPGGFNSTTTRLWVNLTFQPASGVQTIAPIADDDLSTTWNVAIAGQLPESGAIYFPSTGEIITYTGRGAANTNYIHNVRRAQYGTTAAALDARSIGEYLQYTGLILYGPDGAVPDDEKAFAYDKEQFKYPMLAGSSTNSSWRYESFYNIYTPPNLGIFGDGSLWASGAPTRYAPFAGSWTYEGPRGSEAYTTATDSTGVTAAFGATAEWTAMGFKAKLPSSSPRPTPGEENGAGRPVYYAFTRRFAVPLASVRVIGRRIRRGDPTVSPSAPQLYADADVGRKTLVWDAGSGVISNLVNAAFDQTISTLDDGQGRHRLSWQVSGNSYIQADIDTMVIGFDGDTAPIVVVGDERSDYDLNLLLHNETTGDRLKITLPDMELNESLIIDCEGMTAVYSGDNSNQYAAVKRVAGRPQHWLRLAPGSNTITAYELGMGTLGIEFEFEARYYT